MTVQSEVRSGGGAVDVTSVRYERSVELAVPPGELFAFCASRSGFERQFPHRVGDYSGDAAWTQGSRFAFRYKFLGLWLGWDGEIVDWDPPYRFIDRMNKGTFKRFVHTHAFQACSDGTRYTDSINFTLGLGALVDRTLGIPMIERTFRQRHERLADIFGAA